jgi:hypothetical protein
MRRTLALSSLLVVLTMALLIALPRQAEAECVRCQFNFHWTSGQWGMGSTCAEAETNSIIAAYNYADTLCTVCETGAEEIVTPCSFSNGMWKADGRIQYKCEINLCQ